MFAASHKFHFYEFVEKVIFNASVLLALRSSVRFCDTVIVRIVMAGGGGGEDGVHGAGYFFGGSCEGKLTCSHLLEAPLPKTTAIFIAR